VLFFNLYNILISLGIAFTFMRLPAGIRSRMGPILFVLTSLYCTFWWNYLRRKIPRYTRRFVLGFYYHLTGSFIARGGTDEGRRNLILAGMFLSMLILSRRSTCAGSLVLLAAFYDEYRRSRIKPKIKWRSGMRFFFGNRLVFYSVSAHFHSALDQLV